MLPESTLCFNIMAVKQPPEDFSSNLRQPFEVLANDLVPVLHRWSRAPQRLVSFAKAKSPNFFGLQLSPASHAISDLPSLEWGKGSDLILDFGIHMVGTLSFQLSCIGANMDAPCRLRLTFGESPLDVAMSMDDVQTWISTSWLPDEIINVDYPQMVLLPRRYSFRFLRIQVIDTSSKYKVSFSEVSCQCVSAISQDHEIEAVDFADPVLQAIDHISISTLRDCMQTVFEDGPRRDRRLWIGDLRLQAIANYRTLRDLRLVKRCILQFAAVVREDGSLPACIFEKPNLSASTDYIVDYDALYSVIVYEYIEASGDLELGHLLWSTVLECVQRAISCVNSTTHIFESSRTNSFIFLDWEKQLDKNAGAHGLLIFCLKTINKLASLLGKPAPYTRMVENMSTAASLFIKHGVFVSGPEEQVSYASASWLVLSGAFPDSVARNALLSTLTHPSALKPLTPYAWHYVCDALMTVGCYEECIEILKSYWGGMVKAGADTFWECYNAQDANASPYGDVRNNSWCHAWSCTPTYFLRGKLFGEVRGKKMGTITVRELDERWITRSIAQEDSAET